MTIRPVLEKCAVVVAATAFLACSASEGDAQYGATPPGANGGSGGAGGGSSGTGAVGGNAGTAAGGGGGPSASLPDPGPPPTSAVGMFKASKLQEDASPPSLSVSALFTNPAFNLTTTSAKAMLAHYDDVPLDGCKALGVGIQVGSSDQPNPIDVGALGMRAPDGQVHEVPRRQFGPAVFYEGQLPGTVLTPVGEYALLGTGWEGTFWSPGELQLTTPPLDGNPVSVPRSQPFPLRWTGVPDGQPVLVFLMQGDTMVVCRAADDGEFDIPTSAMSAFEMTGGAWDPGGDQEIRVQRMTWYPVIASNGVVTAVAQCEVGARFEVAYE